ncbi:ribonuclease H-like superfamily protein [Striga asiatica]|uniref:Ribonuclease H-like superfamily protein n=1 Tax=Striga asiatica TaxID=4170 RepID=A0A5A7RF00_STRAF|nr:ribonuclease H-like superfamily protein [Striga asiatica]
MTVQSTMQRGIRFEVKDGKPIKVWEDPWVPTLPNFRLKTPLGGCRNLMKVSELMDNTGRGWNHDLLQTLFNSQEVGEIRKIKNLDPLSRDIVCWNWDAKGEFSVASVV